MSFAPYPRYKDSGVEWLGEVPEGWELCPLKKYAELNGRIGFRGYTTADLVDENEGAITLSPSNMNHGNIILTKCTYISWNKYEESPEIQLKNNDIVFVKTGSTYGKIAYCQNVEYPTTINPQLMIIRISQISSRFLFFSLQSKYLTSVVDVNNTGSSIPTITQELISNLDIPFPPLPEQTTIAAFLDCETAKIDNLIHQQKKLVDLLKEKRQAVISHAVTKGLNPNAPMKDSGVEWLGDVPQGWEVKPIKKLGSIISGYAFPSSDFVAEGEIRVLKISNIQTGYLDWTDESYLPKSSYISSFCVKNGDIIFALTRPIISTGIKAAVATISDTDIVMLNQRNALFRPLPTTERKFLYYILFDYSFKAAFENYIDFTGQQPNISPIDIGNIFVAIPNFTEQTAIVAFLDQETAKIDNLINQAQKATTLLQERRTALISAAVTGKIDVRGFVKPQQTY